MKCCFCFDNINKSEVFYKLIPCYIKNDETQYINCNNDIACHEKCIANNNNDKKQTQDNSVKRNTILDSLVN